MVATLILWALILGIIWIYGWGALRALRPLLLQQTNEPPSSGLHHFTLTALTGLVVVSTYAQTFSLFGKVSLWAFVALLAGAAAIAAWGWHSGQFTRPKWKKMPVLGGLLLGLAVLTIFENATHTPSNPDTGIYHAQAIRWIETYGVVPGLGNLNTRFAFNSSWLVTHALFSLKFLELWSFHLVASVLFLLSTLFFFDGVLALLRRKETENEQHLPLSGVFSLFLLPLSFEVLASEISSPGTDLPVTLLLWMLLVEWMKRVESGEKGLGRHALFIFLLCFYCVTVKLSAAPVLLLVVGLGLELLRMREFKRIFILGGLGLLILAPWMARNVVLSGYLVYPLPEVDLFDVDWKIPRRTAELERDYIKAWAIDPATDIDIVFKRSFQGRTRLWFAEMTANRRAIVLGAAAAPLMLAGLWLLPGLRRLTRQFARVWLAVLTALCGAAYWFFSAPDIRFGYGWLLPLLVFTVAPVFLLTEAAARRWLKRPQLFLQVVVLLLALYQGMVLVRSFNAKDLSARVILPRDYWTYPTRRCDLKNTSLWCADAYSECWYDPFPCVPIANPVVGLRGSRLAEGFRVYD
jgi:hypothetical protein